MHSARASGATYAYLNGVAFTTIKEAGGWVPDAAPRIDLDAVAAKTLEADAETRQTASWSDIAT